MSKSSRVRPVRFAAVALSLALLGAIGCSSADMGDGADDDEGQIDDATSTSADEIGGCYQCSNCVDYARCRQPRLPHGLTSYADKRAHINSHTAHRGCVAIINTGSYYGHVAYVNSTKGGIHIDEGNWPSGHCGTRSGSASSLHIAGYFCP